MFNKFKLFAIILVVASQLSCSGGSSTDAQAVNVKLIAFNDFHGRLMVDNDRSATVVVQDPTDPSGVKSIYAGGAAFLATLVKELKASTDYSIVVAAGDIIGASQPIAGLTSEEGAIDVMNQIGLEVSSVGNHEFDKGKDELLRMQNGGCKPGVQTSDIGKITCINNSQSRADGKFGGAKYKYLAANVIDQSTNKQLLDGVYVKKFGPATVGFIGLTLKGTASSTSGADGLTFTDEATVINKNAAELKKSGADAVVVLIHQGGFANSSFINDQSCPGMSGELTSIVSKLNGVDVVVSGHTHQEYICRDPSSGILYTSAGLYGYLVTDINIKIIPGKGVIEKSARTLPVVNNLNNAADLPAGYKVLAADPATQNIIDAYNTATEEPLRKVHGYISGLLSRCERSASIESPMGDVVADSYLDSYLKKDSTATNVIAFTNVGGLRSSIPYQNGGAVTFNELYTVAPFGNNLVYKDITGSQLKRLLETQWESANCRKKLPDTDICGRILQPSKTLKYTWDYALGQGKPAGEGNLLQSVEVLDTTTNQWNSVVDTQIYRVVINDYMADKDDDFPILISKEIQKVDFGKNDLDALVGYFENTIRQNQIIPLPTPVVRGTCVNCPPLGPNSQILCNR